MKLTHQKHFPNSLATNIARPYATDFATQKIWTADDRIGSKRDVRLRYSNCSVCCAPLDKVVRRKSLMACPAHYACGGNR
jgi:hypothetical protein